MHGRKRAAENEGRTHDHHPRRPSLYAAALTRPVLPLTVTSCLVGKGHGAGARAHDRRDAVLPGDDSGMRAWPSGVGDHGGRALEQGGPGRIRVRADQYIAAAASRPNSPGPWISLTGPVAEPLLAGVPVMSASPAARCGKTALGSISRTPASSSRRRSIGCARPSASLSAFSSIVGSLIASSLLQSEVKDVLRLLQQLDIAQPATHFQQGPSQDRQRHEEAEVAVLPEGHSRARRFNPTRNASALPATA